MPSHSCLFISGALNALVYMQTYLLITLVRVPIKSKLVAGSPATFLINLKKGFSTDYNDSDPGSTLHKLLTMSSA